MDESECRKDHESKQNNERPHGQIVFMAANDLLLEILDLLVLGLELRPAVPAIVGHLEIQAECTY